MSKSQIDEMVSMLTGAGLQEEGEPETEAPSTEEPEEVATEAPSTETPDEEEEELGEEEEESEEESEEEEEETEEEEEDPRDARINALLAQVNRLSALHSEQGGTTAKPQPKEKDKGKEEQQEKIAQSELPKEAKDVLAQLTEMDLLSEEDLDVVVDDPAILNKRMKGWAAKVLQVVTDAVGVAAQQAAQQSSQSIDQKIAQQVTMREAARAFYNQNKDLIPYGGYVKVIYDQVLQEHMAKEDSTLEAVFEDVEARVRKDLRLKKEAGKPSKGKKPALPGAKGIRGGRKGKKAEPKVDAQTAAMMDLLED